METRIAELRYKEVISVNDGSRFGYVGDMEVDLESGQVRALVVPGRLRLFGLLGREEDRVFPWEAVRRLRYIHAPYIQNRSETRCNTATCNFLR